MKFGFDRSMTTNFVSLAAYQGINYLLPLISIPFLSRMLGDTYFGLYSFGWATIQYLVMFSDFGFNLSATKYISVHKDNPETVNRFLNSVYISRILLGIVAFAILLVLVLCVAKYKAHLVFFLLFFGVVLGNVMTPLWFFQGMEKMKYMTTFNILAKLLSFLPIFVVVRSEADYLWIPVFFSVGYIVAGLISLYIVFVKEGMKWFLPSGQEVKSALQNSASYFLSRVSSSMFTNVNVLVLGFVTSYEVVGFYARAEKIYQAYNQLLTPLTGVLFPHVAKTRDIAFFKRVFAMVNRINVPLVVLFFAGAGILMTFIYGDPTQETITVFRILICGCLLTIPSMLLGYPFLAALGHATYTNVTIMIVSAIHVVALILLYSFGGLSVYSLAAVVVFSEVILFLFRLRAVIKHKLFK